MSQLYVLTPAPQVLSLPDLTSLDAISRQLPAGLYSTFRTFDGGRRVLDLEHHLRRLYDPLAALAVTPEVSVPEVRSALRQVLKDFAPGEARVRVSLSTSEAPGRVFLALEPLIPPAETVYQRGVQTVLSPVKRATPRLKTTAFIGASDQARQSIQKSGVYEALMVRNGRILEGLTSNFYAVKAGTLVTAREGILLGITRRAVLRVARVAGLNFDYRALQVAELPEIDEAFITSSGRGVVPVVEIDGQPVGNGQVGPVARQLREAYDAYVVRQAEEI